MDEQRYEDSYTKNLVQVWKVELFLKPMNLCNGFDFSPTIYISRKYCIWYEWDFIAVI